MEKRRGKSDGSSTQPEVKKEKSVRRAVPELGVTIRVPLAGGALVRMLMVFTARAPEAKVAVS